VFLSLSFILKERLLDILFPSIILNVLKLLWTGNSLTKSLPVFDMTAISTDSRIKNIAQCMLSQELIGNDPHTFGILILGP